MDKERMDEMEPLVLEDFLKFLAFDLKFIVADFGITFHMCVVCEDSELLNLCTTWHFDQYWYSFNKLKQKNVNLVSILGIENSWMEY